MYVYSISRKQRQYCAYSRRRKELANIESGRIVSKGTSLYRYITPFAGPGFMLFLEFLAGRTLTESLLAA